VDHPVVALHRDFGAAHLAKRFGEIVEILVTPLDAQLDAVTHRDPFEDAEIQSKTLQPVLLFQHGLVGPDGPAVFGRHMADDITHSSLRQPAQLLGTAVLFDRRTWHSRSHNTSGVTRKALFFGYSYRWLRGLDYNTMPEELLEGCDPIRRQLLGDGVGMTGWWQPRDDDVPLKIWLEERGLA